MNWYKLATVNFSPKNYIYPDRNDTVLSVCGNLATAMHPKYPFVTYDTFQPDGDCFDRPTGVINIYMDMVPTEEQDQVINDTKQELKKLELEIDENVIKNTYKDNAIAKGIPEQDAQSSLNGKSMDDLRVARITILRNYNVEFREVKEMFRTDHAPELNMTASNAKRIVEDFLGLPSYEEFDVNEAKTRIEAKLASPELAEAVSDDLNTYNGYDIKYIKIRLNNLLALVKWCINHGYESIQVA